MTNKLFTVVGVSTLNGKTKVRFANDVMRVKILAKNGHEDITMIELDEAMSKYEAVEFISKLDDFADPEAQDAIYDYLDRNAPKTLAGAESIRAALDVPEAVVATDTEVETA